MSVDAIAGNVGQTGSTAQRIAGVRALKGLMLYGATLTFAGLYAYFIVEISLARAGSPPRFDATMVSAAAALAGVLGSAFALAVGTESKTTSQTPDARRRAESRLLTRVANALYDDPKHASSASWPKTVGIWVYAVVAAAVALTYVLNQTETPTEIKALAVAFGGYVLALVTAEYKNAS